jgi:putative hydrolase of the HAD superfamily
VITAVIFDLGGVLAANGRQSDLSARFPAEHAELVRSIFMGPYHEDTDHPWHRLERGEISMEAMREQVGRMLAEAGVSFPEAPRGDDGSVGFAFRPNEPVVDLVERLRTHGVRTGVLTNNVAEMRPLWWPMLEFERLFDDIVDSSDVGMRKPNPAIYHLALERLGVAAAHTAFLDDVASNVEAAVAVGMTGIVVDEDPLPAVRQVLELTGLA